MKNLLLCMSMLLVAFSCKKYSPAIESPKSQWTYDGVLYKGFALARPLGSDFSASERNNQYGLESGHYIAIDFYYGYMPSKNGIYKVKSYTKDSTQCKVSVGILGMGGPLIDFASVDSNAEVSISVSATGKLSASFSNVVLSNYEGTQTRKVSGSLEEQ